MDLNSPEIKETKLRLEEKFYNLEVLSVETLKMSFNATSWDRYLISLEAKKSLGKNMGILSMEQGKSTLNI